MLKVSRSDIDINNVTPYSMQERFIKIPIENYFAMKDWAPIRPQVALINAINNPAYRFVTAALSRRTGKTEVANIIAQLVALVPNCSVLIMSPNYQLSGLSFNLQRKMLREFGVEVLRDNAKDRIIELINGSIILMGSVEQVDSCVGRSYDLILFDEAALTPKGKEAFEVALRPTLDKPHAKAIFISTPRGKNNWFCEFYERGFSDEFPKWVSIHSDYRENPRLSLDDVEEARRSMSKDKFEQEYEANFSIFEGKIYNFNEEIHIFDDSSTPNWQKMEIIAGLDVGFKDETALCILAHDYVDNIFYVLDEYQQSKGATSQHAEVIQAKIAQWGIEFIFVDSSAQQLRYDLAHGYDISTINAKKEVLPGIGYLQSVVESGRLRVHSSCQHVIGMLRQYRWDARENLVVEKPVHDKYSHMADALRYAIYTYNGSMGSIS